jgi:hypothetical protein
VQPIGKRNKKPDIIIAIVIIAVVVIVLMQFVVLPLFHSGGTASYSDTGKILSAGCKITLAGSNYTFIKYTSTSSSIINGSIASTNGLYFYIMDPSQYSTYVNSSASSSLDRPSYYNISIGSSSSFSTHIPPGTWDIVLENPHLNSSTTFTVHKLTGYTLGTQTICS